MSKGSKRIAGDRYPSGDLRKQKQLAPTVIYRTVHEVVRAGGDPKWGTLIGAMRLRNELTDRQAEAAFEVGRIYGRYEALSGLCRSARSASYERAHGDILLDPEAQERRDRAERAALYAWEKLQANAHMQIRKTRDIVERICVEDRMIDWSERQTLLRALDSLAADRRRKSGRKLSAPLHFNKHEDRTG